MTRDSITAIGVLKNAFPETTIVDNIKGSAVLKVEHTPSNATDTSRKLTLTVVLPPDFPSSPPIVTTLGGSMNVPISALYSPDASKRNLPWQPRCSSIIDAVQNAFANVDVWWGSVNPPTLSSIEQALYHESDDLLVSIVQNPNCLDAFCYQLPVIRQMRQLVQETFTELEKNLDAVEHELPARYSRSYDKLREAQDTLQSELVFLKDIQDDPLLNAVATPAALISTLEEDIRTLRDQCTSIGKEALEIHETDKRKFQAFLSDYKAKSKRMHIIDMKRSIYKTQCESEQRH